MGNGASMSPREDDGIRYKASSSLSSYQQPSGAGADKEGAWLKKTLKLVRRDAYDDFSDALRKATRVSGSGSGSRGARLSSSSSSSSGGDRLGAGNRRSLSDDAWVALLRTAAAHGSICCLELLLQYVDRHLIGDTPFGAN